MSKLNLELADEAAALRLAACFAAFSPQKALVYLTGDLGTGKTTFSRGFIQAAGHPGNVKSPTYTLVETYLLPHKTIHHMDLYRLADAEELEYLGIHDLLDSGLCLIEWPQRGQGVLPAADLSLQLDYSGQGRRMQAEAHNPATEQWLAQVQSHFQVDPQI